MRCSHLRVLVTLACLVGFAALCGAAETYSWQKPYAKVDPKGNLTWAPQMFAFEKGQTVRYIDFAGGNDANPGTSPDKAWKHHPWDPQATGQAKAARGVDTYVFKRGVVYRGNLVVRESGRPGDPIRLTSDPSWGQGDAVICGSELVSGWKLGAQNRDIPEAQKVWTAKLDYLPRRVWMVGKDGEVTRIPLARTPNWTVSDPEDVMSDWWVWENPQWWVEANRTTTVDGKKMCLGIDTKHLTQDPLLLQGRHRLDRVGHRHGHAVPHAGRAVQPAEELDRFRGQVVRRQRADQHRQPLLPGGQAAVPRLAR